MKKLTLLLLILCVTFCACTKSSEKPVLGTDPTNTPTSTEKAEITRVDNVSCMVCGKITNCKEYIVSSFNEKLNDTVEQAFYFCDNCYDKAVINLQDRMNYYKLYSALFSFGISEKVNDFDRVFWDYFSKPKIIEVTKDGIKYEESAFMDKVLSQIKDLDSIKTNGNTYKIELVSFDIGDGYQLFVTDSEPPANIVKVNK